MAWAKYKAAISIVVKSFPQQTSRLFTYSKDKLTDKASTSLFRRQNTTLIHTFIVSQAKADHKIVDGR